MAENSTSAKLPYPVAHPWMPDQGDGTYRNPVICADYSDPDVIRDGDDFWLTASSFNCTPGLPILHSRDLVNWTIVNYAITANPDPRNVFDVPQHGCGVWAPAIRKHAGKFWIFFPLPDEGIYVTTADDPRGKWSEPWCLIAGKGLIDPCPLWDDDGKAYLVHAYANSRCGIKHQLRVRRMSPDAKQLLGEGEVVWNDPTNHPTCEGPKFHKHNGWYYLSAPAGGVATGWQLVLRSRNAFGPYEGKVVLAQGNTPINGPHQGAIIDAPDGSWWFLHFQEAQPYGRVCHLQPMKWENDWPLMGVNQDANGKGDPVLQYRKPVQGQPAAIPQTSDEFDAPTLGLQWQWHANSKAGWHALDQRPSHLRLFAKPMPNDFWLQPNLLLQKTPARQFKIRTEVHVKGTDPHTQAGLIVMGIKHAALAVNGVAPDRRVSLIVHNEVVASRPIKSCGGILELTFHDGGACNFAFGERGEPLTPIGDSFQAVEGKWIGAKLGLFCRSLAQSTDGFVDVDYFRFA
ncbi:MAG: glycoside hydrolase 43 family protein [Tepidisphaeraceae bacterium]